MEKNIFVYQLALVIGREVKLYSAFKEAEKALLVYWRRAAMNRAVKCSLCMGDEIIRAVIDLDAPPHIIKYRIQITSKRKYIRLTIIRNPDKGYLIRKKHTEKLWLNIK